MSGLHRGYPTFLIDSTGAAVGFVGRDGREWLFPSLNIASDAGAALSSGRMLYDDTDTPKGVWVYGREFLFGSALSLNTTAGLRRQTRPFLVNTQGVPIGMAGAPGVATIFATPPAEGVVAAPLRFASANNQYPNAATVYNLGTAGGLTQTDHYQSHTHYVGQDMASVILATTMQWLSHGLGISNVGNSINIQAMSVTYNGVVVPVTTSGSQTFVIADGANWQADAIPCGSFGGLTKVPKGAALLIKVKWTSTAAATDKFPQGQALQAGDVGFYADPTKIIVSNGVYSLGVMGYSMTNGGVNNTDAKFSNVRLPIFVLGYHSKPAMVFWGDSKTYGTGDTAPACRAIGANRTLFADPTLGSSVQCSGLNMGCPSGMAFEAYTPIASGSLANHEYWYTLGTHAIVGYGTNRINFAEQQALWARIRAKMGVSTTIVQRSLTPRTGDGSGLDKVTITALTTDGSTTTVTGQMADTSGLIEGQSYPISGATPAVYNGTFAIHIVDGTHFTYTAGSVPASNATGTLVLDDQWRTVQYQPGFTGWSVGGTADTFEQQLRGAVASDANLVYHQSTDERSNLTVGTTGYWVWVANGTVKYMTSDGLHEGGATGIGYEKSLCSGGTLTTQAGGTVAGHLRGWVAAVVAAAGG